MAYRRIDELLEKYWNLEISNVEEQELKLLLKKEDLPEQYQKEASLFQYFNKEAEQEPLGEEFDNSILLKIDKEESENSKNIFQRFLKIAAVVAVVVAAWMIILNDSFHDNLVVSSTEDTYEDPQIAYEEAKKALLLVSENLNKGEEYTSEIAIFNEAKRKIENIKN